MQTIIPHLWFDTKVKEATSFYTSIFPDSRIVSSVMLHDTPSGDVEMVTFEIMKHRFMAINGGPYFKPNPSISFMINFDPSQDKDAKERIDTVWQKLIDGGKALMPIDAYPFSERYGWVEDKYGFSWQLILTKPEGEERPLVLPTLLYVTEKCEAAEEATDYYISVFKEAPGTKAETKRGAIARYPAGMNPNKEGSIMFTDFKLAGQWFVAMDGSSKMHDFRFNEAVSFIIRCKNQNEIDYYWEKLSADPKAEQCGWLKDKYGVSWQVTPADMDTMMKEGTSEQRERVTQAFLKMKKFDVAKLKEAYRGE